MYNILDGQIVRVEDGAKIPSIDGNRHYQEYLEWVAEGNVAEDITPIKSAEELIIEVFENADAEHDDDSEIVCNHVMKRVKKLNKKKGKSSADKNAMEVNSSLAAILSKLTISKRPGEAKNLIIAYRDAGDETYFSIAEMDEIIDYITAKGY